MSARLENSLRAAVFLVGAIGALYLSPWVPSVCMLLSVLRFRAYEAIALGVLVDSLWLPAGFGLPLFTIGGIAAVWISEPLRSEFLMS